jgi:diguanylate cyclase (GGDEF)-like protein
MTPELVRQLALMGFEAVLAAGVLLAFFHFRRTLGLAPLHATLAAFCQLAIFMAGAFYLQITDDLLMNPGSVVLFPAAVFALLFVHIREDAAESRRVILGLLAANAVVGALALLIGQHLQSAVMLNPHGVPAELFAQHPRLLAAGTVALLADVGLVVLAYEALGRALAKLPFLRLYAAALFALAADTLIFVTGGFIESPHYGSILFSALAGKAAAAMLYAIPISLYLRYFGEREEPAPLGVGAKADVFELLTYRERYEELQRRSLRDPLTGLFHRGVFDTMIAAQLARVARTGNPFTLLMVDVDRFKEVNDLFGHLEGDAVLRAVARALEDAVRGSDFVCRFGGEEFAVLLPDTAPHDALVLADRMRSAVTRECRARTAVGVVRPLTVSIGLAAAPHEARTAEALIDIADRRLYDAKRAGRDRISTGAFAAASGLRAVGA